MNYIEVRFFIEPYEEYISDLLAAELGEIGFNSFVPTEESLDAYILENAFDEAKVKSLLADKLFTFASSKAFSKIYASRLSSVGTKLLKPISPSSAARRSEMYSSYGSIKKRTSI